MIWRWCYLRDYLNTYQLIHTCTTVQRFVKALLSKVALFNHKCSKSSNLVAWNCIYYMKIKIGVMTIELHGEKNICRLDFNYKLFTLQGSTYYLLAVWDPWLIGQPSKTQYGIQTRNFLDTILNLHSLCNRNFIIATWTWFLIQMKHVS